MASFYGKPVSPESSQEAFVISLRQPVGAGPVLPAWPPSRPRPPFSKRPRDPTSRVPAVCRGHSEREPISVPLAKRAGLHRSALYGLSAAVKRHRRQRRFVDSAAFVGLARRATHYTADGLVLIAPCARTTSSAPACFLSKTPTLFVPLQIFLSR